MWPTLAFNKHEGKYKAKRLTWITTVVASFYRSSVHTVRRWRTFSSVLHLPKLHYRLDPLLQYKQITYTNSVAFKLVSIVFLNRISRIYSDVYIHLHWSRLLFNLPLGSYFIQEISETLVKSPAEWKQLQIYLIVYESIVLLFLQWAHCCFKNVINIPLWGSL